MINVTVQRLAFAWLRWSKKRDVQPVDSYISPVFLASMAAIRRAVARDFTVLSNTNNASTDYLFYGVEACIKNLCQLDATRDTEVNPYMFYNLEEVA